VDQRHERIGLNEAVFREVNERIREVGAPMQATDEQLDLVCECGLVDCAERIRMSVAEYERLRAEAHRFAVVPGHEFPDIERVIERAEGYDVVEKVAGDAAELAEKTDPRD
jgi:hypothetical protein